MNALGNDIDISNDYSRLHQSEIVEANPGGLEEEKGEDQTMDRGNEDEQEPNNNQIYYKFGTPMYPNETDWSITLSRNDFPWNEIKFNHFTSKDCFDKYTSIVKDA